MTMTMTTTTITTNSNAWEYALEFAWLYSVEYALEYEVHRLSPHVNSCNHTCVPHPLTFFQKRTNIAKLSPKTQHSWAEQHYFCFTRPSPIRKSLFWPSTKFEFCNKYKSYQTINFDHDFTLDLDVSFDPDLNFDLNLTFDLYHNFDLDLNFFL